MIKRFFLTAATLLCWSVCLQATYNGTPVIPEQITKSNFANYGLTANNYQNYETWYAIGTAEELYGFALLVNRDGNRFAKGILIDDIVVNNNVTNSAGEPNGNSFYAWTPIGTSKNKFSGNFNGQGHTISGLFFNDTSKADYPLGGKYVGLFGFVEGEGSSSKSTIANTGIVDSYFNGYQYVGGIYGYSSCDVNVINCYNTATVTGNNNVGGICGFINNGTIFYNCYNTGKITSVGGHVDGICGYIYGIGIFDNCYSLRGCAIQNGVKVDGGYPAKDFESGKIAWLLNEKSSDKTVWRQNLNGNADMSPVLDDTHGVVYASEPCYNQFANTPVAKAEHNYKNGFCTKCNGYEEPASSGGWYEIDNAGKLYWYADMVNNHAHTSSRARLTADIVVNAKVQKKNGNLKGKGRDLRTWTPIGHLGNKYSGYFDGQGHSVSGLYINNRLDVKSPGGGNYIGLFGYMRGGEIKNVCVVDSYFCGRYGLGGICGQVYRGTISNCHSDATVIGDSRFVGGISGSGNDYGEFKNCFNTGKVKGGTYYAGGICGKGAVSNCFYLSGCATDGDGVVQGGKGTETRGQAAADEKGVTTAVTLAEIQKLMEECGLHKNVKRPRHKK